jgi:hypothetical protein
VFSTITRATKGLEVKNSSNVGIKESSQFLSLVKATIRNVLSICSVMTSCAPTINKFSGLILDGHRIGQENLIEDDYTEKEIEDKPASTSIHV